MTVVSKGRRAPWVWGLGLACALAAAASQRTDAQQALENGQNVVPVYEGWKENPDGTFDLLFGYFNRNWDEEIDIPVGPDNFLEPGPQDQGQPTHFLPRRNLFAFAVHVPKDFRGKEMVWTLTSKGRTQKAYASFKPDYVMTQMTITGNWGNNGVSEELELVNKAPVLEIEGTKTRTAKVGQPIVLTAVASDDGIPKLQPLPALTVGGGGQPASFATRNVAHGLRVAWLVYRGAGKVTFDPPQFKVYIDTRGNSPWAPGWVPPAPPSDGKWTVRATFSEPGTYTVRADANDGALSTDKDIVVTVSP